MDPGRGSPPDRRARTGGPRRAQRPEWERRSETRQPRSWSRPGWATAPSVPRNAGMARVGIDGPDPSGFVEETPDGPSWPGPDPVEPSGPRRRTTPGSVPGRAEERDALRTGRTRVTPGTPEAASPGRNGPGRSGTTRRQPAPGRARGTPSAKPDRRAGGTGPHTRPRRPPSADCGEGGSGRRERGRRARCHTLHVHVFPWGAVADRQDDTNIDDATVAAFEAEPGPWSRGCGRAGGCTRPCSG